MFNRTTQKGERKMRKTPKEMLDEEEEKLRKMFNPGYTVSNVEQSAYTAVAMIRVLKKLERKKEK